MLFIVASSPTPRGARLDAASTKLFARHTTSIETECKARSAGRQTELVGSSLDYEDEPHSTTTPLGVVANVMKWRARATLGPLLS
jgi:hypothetical protein